MHQTSGSDSQASPASSRATVYMAIGTSRSASRTVHLLKMALFILIIGCSSEAGGRAELVSFMTVPLFLVCAVYIWDSIRVPQHSSRRTRKLPALCKVEKCCCIEINVVNRALNLDSETALSSRFSPRMPLWPLTSPCAHVPCSSCEWHHLLSGVGEQKSTWIVVLFVLKL